jgi:hypothetical protein
MFFKTFPHSPPGIAHLRAWRRYRLASWSEWCVVFWTYFFRSNKNCCILTTMVDIRVTSGNETYKRGLNYKPYVPSTVFGRTRVAKLFLALLFSYPDVGAQFLKDVGLIRSSKCAVGWPLFLGVNFTKNTPCSISISCKPTRYSRSKLHVTLNTSFGINFAQGYSLFEE